jgi:predicted phage terminase large subunit-like protein
LSDWSVCTTWGLKGSEFYLLDVLRRKLGFPDLKRAVIAWAAEFRPDAILIEDRASGTQLVQELIAAGCRRATRVLPQGDKVMRMHAQSATIENGFVLVPEEAPSLADYLAEFASFPKGRHDDQVDSTAQALAWAKRGLTGAEGLIEYYRRLVEGRGRALVQG